MTEQAPNPSMFLYLLQTGSPEQAFLVTETSALLHHGLVEVKTAASLNLPVKFDLDHRVPLKAFIFSQPRIRGLYPDETKTILFKPALFINPDLFASTNDFDVCAWIYALSLTSQFFKQGYRQRFAVIHHQAEQNVIAAGFDGKFTRKLWEENMTNSMYWADTSFADWIRAAQGNENDVKSHGQVALKNTPQFFIAARALYIDAAYDQLKEMTIREEGFLKSKTDDERAEASAEFIYSQVLKIRTSL